MEIKKNIFKGLIWIFFICVIVPLITLTWLAKFFVWLVKYDGYSHNNNEKNYGKTENLNKEIKKDKIDEEIEKAFAIKPFPTPYTPASNPLYLQKAKRLRDVKTGRFVKVKPLPITRYGTSTSERFRGKKILLKNLEKLNSHFMSCFFGKGGIEFFEKFKNEITPK